MGAMPSGSDRVNDVPMETVSARLRYDLTGEAVDAGLVAFASDEELNRPRPARAISSIRENSSGK